MIDQMLISNVEIDTRSSQKFANSFDFSKSSKQQNQNDENIVDNIK